MENSKLKKLESNYSKLQEKYSLPSFDELNRDFSIERMANSETKLIVLETRRYLQDKLFSYLGLIEKILNPTNAPMGILLIEKNLKEDERKTIKKIYEKLLNFYLDSIKVDLNYSEEENAKIIKDYYKLWLEMKSPLYKIFSSVKEEIKKEKKKNNNNSYLG